MAAAIRIDNLGKCYRLGQTHAGSVREAVARGFDRLLGRKHTVRGSPDGRTLDPDGGFWALKDVSFEVQPGEVVGIIGRNGSGKSTLLKVLSQITAPTRGRVEINGRVASLLEVGTGFHPELSGRENVYLNGAILGMSRAEVRRKFDDIVTFAEVEQFIDTPVKRYSSGMYVRLAFAVAAHLEPEILVVDEVLAVGDASFQKKCLGKMGEVASHGKTVLFVSHNMAAVTRLCNQGVLLTAGKGRPKGPIEQIVHAYLGEGKPSPAQRSWPNGDGPGNHIAQLLAVRMRDNGGVTVHAADIRRPVGLEIEYEVFQSGHTLVPNCHLANGEGVCVFSASDILSARAGPARPGLYRSIMWIPGNFLSEGTHIASPALSTMDPVTVHFVEWDAVSFEVVDSLDGDSARGQYAGVVPGVVRPLLNWQTLLLEQI